MGFRDRKRRGKDSPIEPQESRSPVRPIADETRQESENPQGSASGVILARHKYCPFCIREIALSALGCPNCKKQWPGYKVDFELNGRFLVPILLPLLLVILLFNGMDFGNTVQVEPYTASAVWEMTENTEPAPLLIDYQPPTPVKANHYVIFAGQGAVDKASKSTTVSNSSFIVNISTSKFHVPGCWHISQMNEENKRSFSGSYSDAIKQNLIPCKDCIG